MSSLEFLSRHFSRMGARLNLRGPAYRQTEKVRIDVERDRGGEYFDVRCQNDVVPEVLDVRPEMRHLVLLVRERKAKNKLAKNKFLLGHDERHWFAAAVPDQGVHDVRTAMASLRPEEAVGRTAIRQGEWFFIPAPVVTGPFSVIHRNEPLRRGAFSKPHVCEELMRHSGVVVMVSSWAVNGITETEYRKLIETNENARRAHWDRMVRDAQVYARGRVRHSDHKTVYLDGWHTVYMNRERFAPHGQQIAFLD